ncbi:MAG: hypothetical protein WC716_12445 [Chitinophagaceae bacterium]|jgi:hypothetical protein
MKNTENIEILKRHYGFLINDFDFSIKEIKSYNYALYVKFVSKDVGIYFIYEFRDIVPQVQFTKLNGGTLEPRVGLYTIQKFYIDKDFKLQSFFLDEILSFKEHLDYQSYFKSVKTIEDAIMISSTLIDKYAKDFIKGNELSYKEIDKWYRAEVSE